MQQKYLVAKNFLLNTTGGRVNGHVILWQVQPVKISCTKLPVGVSLWNFLAYLVNSIFNLVQIILWEKIKFK